MRLPIQEGKTDALEKSAKNPLDKPGQFLYSMHIRNSDPPKW